MALLNPTADIGHAFITKRNTLFWGATIASLAGSFSEPSYYALRSLDKLSGLPVTFFGLSTGMAALGGSFAYTKFTDGLTNEQISARRHNAAVIAGGAAGLYVSATTLANPMPDMNVQKEGTADMTGAALGAILFLAVNLVTKRATRPAPTLTQVIPPKAGLSL